MPAALLHREPLSLPAGGAELAAPLFGALREQLGEAPMAFLDSSDHRHTPQPGRSRYSILAFGFGPHSATAERDGREDFLSWLSTAWPEPDDEAADDDVPPFQLGWVGALGYEYQSRFFRVTHAVVFDLQKATAELQSTEPDPSWRARVRQTLASLAVASASTDPGAEPTSSGHHWSGALQDVHARDSRASYLRSIAAAQQQIHLGNTYEACLTTSVNARLHADPWETYLQLRQHNPAPFAQYLQLPSLTRAERDIAVLSTSPERFVQLSTQGRIRSEPIKGTRGRHPDPGVDQQLAADLAGDPKDHAENVMIADLVRNDLSIHAATGSLRTERLCAVETYATVHQMVSTISARLAHGACRARAVLDAFPPGSMTGAPKRSTMEILRQLETGPRGLYSGVAGYFSGNGACDLSVLIRSAVLTRSAATAQGVWDFHLGLGGAITADSDPQAEWDEVITKSRGVLGALGVTFPQADFGEECPA